MLQFVLSLISGIFIAGTAAYLGTLMFEKRMALAADPLGHLTLPGIALALLYGFDIALGAFPFVILGIILIWLFEIKTKLPMEALTAVVYASAVAVAFLFLPIEQAETALVGDISGVSLGWTITLLILCVLVILTVRKIFPKMILINISEDLAKSQGIDIKKYNFLYLGCIAVMVALGVKLVGGLLTAAIVAIPSAAARNFSKNMRSFAILSPLFGIISAILGISLFKLTQFPAGPLIIITAFFIFLISLLNFGRFHRIE